MFASLLLSILIPTTTIDKDVEYSRSGGRAVHMDIYKPAKAGLRPAMIVIHGGGWVGGDKTQMASTSASLAERGFVVANVSYRLAPENKWPAMIYDVQSAVRFMRTNAKKYDVDPERVGALGASAGGHLALMLGMCDTQDPDAPKTPPSSVSVVANFFGVSDFTAMLPAWNGLGDVVFGKKGADIEPAMKEASPLTYLNKGDARVYLSWGQRLVNTYLPVQAARREAEGGWHRARFSTRQGHGAPGRHDPKGCARCRGRDDPVAREKASAVARSRDMA